SAQCSTTRRGGTSPSSSSITRRTAPPRRSSWAPPSSSSTRRGCTGWSPTCIDRRPRRLHALTSARKPRASVAELAEVREAELDGAVGAADEEVVGALHDLGTGVLPVAEDRSRRFGRAELVVFGDGD